MISMYFRRLLGACRGTRVAATLVALAALSGCAGSAPAAAAPSGTSSASTSASPADREVADSRHLTEFQKRARIGHFSTENGQSGFILDRTGASPKARLDGSSVVVILERRGSVPGAYELQGKDIWLRLDESSDDVLLFQGPKERQGVRVLRDADAEPLP